MFFSVTSGLSQNIYYKHNSFFGFQFRPLIPLSVVGDAPFDIQEENFITTITTKMGYNYGGVIRVGISESMAIETGLSYTKRNYQTTFWVPDSNLVASSSLGIVNYDIPINMLVYVKLFDELYMNASLGGSLNFYPSNVRTTVNPFGQHLFIFEGRRGGFFSFDVNANVGFEYRTEKSGNFYLGISGKIPVSPIFLIASEYRYDTQRTVAFGQVEGASFSLDLKYFFHNETYKRDGFKPGPIEQ